MEKHRFWSVDLLQLPAAQVVSPTCLDIWAPKRQRALHLARISKLGSKITCGLPSEAHPEATLKPS